MGGRVRAFRASTSELQRDVLRDGKITDQELAAVHDDFRACLEPRGMTNVAFNAGGGFSHKAPLDWTSDVAQIVSACEEATLGQVGGLFHRMQRNPANADEWQIMADCLIRQGLVPPDYSAEDYGRDVPNGTLPFNDQDALFGACIADPLTAGTG